ncbi:MAG: alanine racemase, partial [Lactobacillus iners]|nr:alanine racemase [Lactobacillus iners]
MISGIHRPTKILVDLAAIKSNVENEIKNLKSGQKLWAVVKANGYGHGSVVISKTAIAAGAQGLCVAILDEAIELRKAGIKVPILVLGITLPKFALLAAENDISLTVGDLDWLKQASTFLSGTKLKIHLAIDSGMGRIGFNEDDAFLKANDYLLAHPEYDVEGMFTHFSTADCHDLEYFDSQVKKFDHFKKMLRIKPKYIHCDNSAASIFNRQVNSDLVRYGIAMYGLNPSSAPHGIEIQPKFTLQPALCFVSELVFVKQIHANNAVGYG